MLSSHRKELHWLERKLLLALKEAKKMSIDEIARLTKLSKDSIHRATGMLSEKGLIYVEDKVSTHLMLGPEGKEFLIKGLPERRLLTATLELGGKALLHDVMRKACLEKDEGEIAIGWARKKGWIRLCRDKEGLFIVADKEHPPGSDEVLIEKLGKGSLLKEELKEDELEGLAILEKRPNVIQAKEEKEKTIFLTDEGVKLAQKIRKVGREVSLLTPELIRGEKWRKVKLARYDVEAPSPIVYPGKIHPVEQVIQEIREIFLQMGFEEIRSPLTELAFWNFDALFQPQDHPAREMMDTFYLSNPTVGRLPSEDVVDRVRRTHENGWITGSTGWRYKWSESEAKKLILRTHTTATSIRFLSKHTKPPVRAFCVDRVYRNERLDSKHLMEFHMYEGIIMEEGVTLRDLMGVLKTFYEKMGIRDVRFWPSYFPYTEPSMQASVYLPKERTWVELCGMGIFRPEVLKPLGIDHPVLAWGGGLERITMLRYGVSDIRELYKNRLSWIRNVPYICQSLLSREKG